MNNTTKFLIQIHSAASLIISFCVYFFAEDMAKAIFFGSLACNIYLRMLSFNFKGIVNTAASGPRVNVLLVIASGMRMAIIAGLYALFILKFNLNLIGLALSFILYKLVLFLTGYYFSLVPKVREQGLRVPEKAEFTET